MIIKCKDVPNESLFVGWVEDVIKDMANKSDRLRLRRHKFVTVNISNKEGDIDGYAKGPKNITIEAPVTKMLREYNTPWGADKLKEVSETILFEVGNCVLDPKNKIHRREYDLNIYEWGIKAGEIENGGFHEFLLGLDQASTAGYEISQRHTEALSTYRDTLNNKGKFLKKAGERRHNITSRLSTNEYYAFRRVYECPSTYGLQKILYRMATPCDSAWQDFCANVTTPIDSSRGMFGGTGGTEEAGTPAFVWLYMYVFSLLGTDNALNKHYSRREDMAFSKLLMEEAKANGLDSSAWRRMEEKYGAGVAKAREDLVKDKG